MVDRPLIHIGFHKTASTLLQRKLFSHPELGFERPERDRKRLQADFICQNPFADMSPRAISHYRNAARRAREAGRTLVISHERLSGYPASGAFDARLIADRLKHCLPEARILIFVREQKSMLYSYYLQYITDGGDMKFADFIRANQPTMYRRPQFDLDNFAFEPCIRYYRKLFTPERVKVIPFEALHDDAYHVARDIVRTCGHDPSRVQPDLFAEQPNAGMPIIMQSIRRLLNATIARNQLAPRAWLRMPGFNRYFPRLKPLFAPTRLIEAPWRHRLERQVEAAIGERYMHSNARLQAWTDYDLAKYGYTMPSEARETLTHMPTPLKRAWQ